MHAITLEFLKDYLKESKKALDIGTGSGWMTVYLLINFNFLLLILFIDRI